MQFPHYFVATDDLSWLDFFFSRDVTEPICDWVSGAEALAISRMASDDETRSQAAAGGVDDITIAAEQSPAGAAAAADLSAAAVVSGGGAGVGPVMADLQTPPSQQPTAQDVQLRLMMAMMDRLERLEQRRWTTRGRGPAGRRRRSWHRRQRRASGKPVYKGAGGLDQNEGPEST